jgi:hypothetical protein
MSILLGNPLLFAPTAAGGYTISRSLRFNSADSAYLSRTPASAGNRRTWTWAAWVKRSTFGSFKGLFAAGSNNSVFMFNDDVLQYYEYNGSTETTQLNTASVFRDPSAWYHIVLAIDTTQATASNRCKLYVNGTQITTFTTATYPTQNYDTYVNSTIQHYVGYAAFSTRYFDGLLADIHFLDGITPGTTTRTVNGVTETILTDFGEFSATTGVWTAKAYTGTYGTNGFYLEFADNSSNTATTLGKDTSGNGNNWLPNNLSVTAGAGNDSLVDVPVNGSQTDTGVGGEVRGNYCTGNPLAIGGGTLSNGNLDYVRVSDPTGNTAGKVLGTIAAATGKWYFEYNIATSSTSSAAIGITTNIQGTVSTIGGTNYVGINSYEYVWRAGGATINNGNFVSYGSAAGNGDVMMCAFDVDAGKIWFGKNGTWFNSSNPSTGTSPAFSGFTGTIMPIFGIGTASGGFDANGSINFGQRPFGYTAPSNFKALNTANLTAPTIVPSTVMDVALYTGNGSTQTVSGLGFSPDFVWIKSRNDTYAHRLLDTVRGATNVLYSNGTDAETADASSLTAFNSNGFTLGSTAGVNGSSTTFASWCWDAGSSTVTNTAGSITSSVRANPSAGFSVVTYTGSGTDSTIGHGLGAAPQLIITKNRSSGSFNWGVYHASAGNTVYGKLNLTDAFSSLPIWQNTTPSSTVFYVGNYNAANQGSDNYVAYCFAPVNSYSAFGSYTGNGSADGPFVFCGFRPRWVMVKRTDSSGTGWQVHDAARNTSNVVNLRLQPSNSDAESSYTTYDFLSNGFKLRDSDASWNASGGTYIYCAFAESPFASNNRAR